MSQHLCPCCGWTVVQADEQPDLLVACANCSQVVSVPGIRPEEIPSCRTEELIDWDTGDEPQAQDEAPLLPVQLCIPLRTSKPARSFGAVGLLCIGIGVFLAIPPGVQQSLMKRLFFGGVGCLFFLAGVYLLSIGLRRQLRRKPARLLSTARLPHEAKHLGIPFALHYYVSSSPVLLFFVGVVLFACAALCPVLLFLGEIRDLRILMVSFCCGAMGVAAIRGAFGSRRLQILVYPGGFVSQRDHEAGVVWRWEDVKIIHLQKNSNVPVMFTYTLRHKDGEMLTFDHHLEFIENQFGARVQHELCRRMLPQLLQSLFDGEQAGFGTLLVSREGLHNFEGFVHWNQIANLTLDGDQLSIRKWGGDVGAIWSVPYENVPNLAVFFALAHLFLRECANPGQSALSVLYGRANVDPAAIQVHSSEFQASSQLAKLS